MPNKLIPIGLAIEEIAKDLNENVIAPAVAAGRAAGLTDEQINLELNRAFFDAFRGLHGFPESHRP